jgi:hypothetical protein
MKRNVLGMISIVPSDFGDLIIKELAEQSHCTILPNFTTKKGVNSSDNDVLSRKGFYCIYKDKVPVYIGYTNHTVRGRIGRFYAAVRGTEHDDETHAGGYKYLKKFGKDLSLISVKSVQFVEENLSISDGITMEDIELYLIREMRPILNSQITKVPHDAIF